MIIAGIRQCSLSNGPGKRFVVLLPGCQHHCTGCSASQGPGSGVDFSLEELLDQLDSQPELDGLTITGGEPFDQAADCTALCRAAHDRGLNVRCHTGLTFESLTAEGNTDRLALLRETDVLVEAGRAVRAAASLAAGQVLTES